MPQLDITLNLIWYFCTVVGLGVLYFHLVFTYIPFFIRYWKFQDVYKRILMLLTLKTYYIYVLLLSDSQYYVINCFGVPYVLTLGYTNKLLDAYSLDVEDYSETVSISGGA